MLSHAFWQRDYGGDRGFDVALPISAEELPPGKTTRLDDGTAWWLVVMGRVARGESARERFGSGALAGPLLATLPPNYPPDSVASYRGFELAV